MTGHYLQVPGARPYYEQRGAGPLLLLIPAGAGDADSYRAIAEPLAEYFTVITYDRHGYSRSLLDDPEQTITLATHTEAAHRLLAALDQGPANVLGYSLGAIIGLELTRQHRAGAPAGGARAAAGGAADGRRADGQPARAADGHGRAAGTGASRGAAKAGGEPGPAARRRLDGGRSAAAALTIRRAERAAFFKYDAPAVARYVPDLAGLRAVAAKIVVAGGSEGRAYAPYRAAAALAAALGQSLVEFPGHHAGFVEYPEAFAERLREVLNC